MSKLLKSSLLSAILFASSSYASEMVIDSSHSEVGFSIKHMMISNVKGKFKEYDGDIEFDTKSKTFTKFDAYVVAKSIDTGIEKRDDHLRSADFFDVAKYPKIHFKMKSHNKENNTLVGDLTMHGVTKEVVLNLSINGVIKDFQGNTRAGFTLNGKINRKDYGLNWNKALEFGGFAVGEEVKLLIELETMEL
jgi:polyisoprenoid-binding protein YceI